MTNNSSQFFRLGHFWAIIFFQFITFFQRIHYKKIVMCVMYPKISFGSGFKFFQSSGQVWVSQKASVRVGFSGATNLQFFRKKMKKNVSAYPFYLATGDKVFITCIHVFLCTLSVPINEIMIRYLKNKPPGKQTFLDRMLIDNHRIFQGINLTYHPFIIFATWGAHTHSIGGYFFGLTLAGKDVIRQALPNG